MNITMVKILLFVLVMLLLFGCSSSPIVTLSVSSRAESRDEVIVCYGTSLTSSGKYPETLQKVLPNAKVYNSGCGGMNSDWGKLNLKERVLDKFKNAADKNNLILIMEFAINDAFRETTYWPHTVSMSESRANLESMIDTVMAYYPECKIYLMTMQVPIDSVISKRNPYISRPYLRSYYQITRDCAEFKNVGLIDNEKEFEQLDKQTLLKYIPDGLHESELGSIELIVPKIISQLKLTNDIK